MKDHEYWSLVVLNIQKGWCSSDFFLPLMHQPIPINHHNDSSLPGNSCHCVQSCDLCHHNDSFRQRTPVLFLQPCDLYCHNDSSHQKILALFLRSYDLLHHNHYTHQRTLACSLQSYVLCCRNDLYFQIIPVCYIHLSYSLYLPPDKCFLDHFALAPLAPLTDDHIISNFHQI